VSLLETRGLTVRFEGLVALADVDVAVAEGETVGVIGPNGSGKTTLFNALTGLYRLAAGDIVFRGNSVAGLEPHLIARLGMSRTFQSSRLCLQLSVFDNVLAGMVAARRTGLLDAVMSRHRARAEMREAITRATHLLGLFNPDLPARGWERAGQLPQIDRRRVEICRALAASPVLLLLDEPSAGMSPEETRELMKDLQIVRDERPGLSIIIIEHDMFVIEGVSARVIALNYGRKIAEGSFAAVVAHPEVREAYLGRERAHA
jgi:branched-chain amino acid transport system ATP-binding protein/sulfate-transporting ATPase